MGIEPFIRPLEHAIENPELAHELAKLAHALSSNKPLPLIPARLIEQGQKLQLLKKEDSVFISPAVQTLFYAI